jgi:sulfite reductase beta subunit-like hemoprotein
LAYSDLIGYAETADRYQRSLCQFERGQTALSILSQDVEERPERAKARQRIVVEALGREKLDELNDWVAGQLERSYAPGA